MCPRMVDKPHVTIFPGPCCDEELFFSRQATTVGDEWGGPIYSCNLTVRTRKAELNLHNAVSHIARSAGVGRWVWNL
jgi:hypothetical protein